MAHIEHEGQVRAASGLTIVLGLWLAVSSFIFTFNGGWQWNQLIFGIVLAILGAVHLSDSRYSWPSWLNMLIGVWLFITAFAVGGGAAFTNVLIASIVAVALAIWDVEATVTSPSSTRHV